MILILGGKGFIANAFVTNFEKVGREHYVLSRREVDYYQHAKLKELIRSIKPDFLVNAAGFTGKPNVDACETNKSQCLLGNAVLPGIIREVCEDCDLPWGHVSSGCIFQGASPHPKGFRETDEPNFSFRNGPCSFYSGSKALGEECLQNAKQTYVWRLRVPFNNIDCHRNYLSKIMRYDRLLDVENSITQLDEFVEACLKCIDAQIPFGTYNIVNTGWITTREIAELVKRELKVDREFQFFRDESEFMHDVAKTPRSSCRLDNSKLVAAGVEMTTVREAVVRALQQWVPMDSRGSFNV